MLVMWYLLMIRLGINLKGWLSCSLQLLADSLFVSRAITQKCHSQHFAIQSFTFRSPFVVPFEVFYYCCIDLESSVSEYSEYS